MTKLKIGDFAPSFNLPGTDDKNYSLESFADKKIVVIVFSCNHCPYVIAYEDRLVFLQETYKEKGVIFIAINANNSSNYPEDSFENMKIRSKQKKFNFPYLSDETQKVAKAYDAVRTPEVFVFNQRRKLRYHGRIDDNVFESEKVTKNYLRNALDSILKKEPILVEDTEPVGCTIKWK
jgi:peroxiredoxin